MKEWVPSAGRLDPKKYVSLLCCCCCCCLLFAFCFLPPPPPPPNDVTGILLVYAPSSTDTKLLVMHKLQVTPVTTAKEVVKLLLTQLNRGWEDAEGYHLTLAEGARPEKIMASDCRPLIMQSRWEEKDCKLILRPVSANV